jgi:hypothetical protein
VELVRNLRRQSPQQWQVLLQELGHREYKVVFGDCKAGLGASKNTGMWSALVERTEIVQDMPAAAKNPQSEPDTYYRGIANNTRCTAAAAVAKETGKAIPASRTDRQHVSRYSEHLEM